MPVPQRRRGLSAIEVLVVLAILSMLVFLILMMLPRRLETARTASCERNLMQLGIALVLYDQDAGHLPTVEALGTDGANPANSPLAALLEGLGLADFRELADPKKRPEKHTGMPVVERRVPGFVCASDPNATAGLFPAPISYRATTGATVNGRDGAFAPGHRTSLAAIEAGDGASYTAAFSERLVGTNASFPGPQNYWVVPGPVPAGGCPEVPVPPWHGDAGSSWIKADWQSTLYSHFLPPSGAPSCLAADGRTAAMGSSSGHAGGVNVLLFDGAVKRYSPSVDLKIWRDLATLGRTQDDSPQTKPSSDGRN